MANIQGMSGMDVRAMTSELSEMLPLWIGKIYQYDSKTLGIRLNGEGGAKYHFFIEVGRRAHLVSSLPESPKMPPSYAMLLRKHLEGGRVTAIGQYGLQRIFYIDIGKKGGTLRLVVELFDEGNAVLLDDAGVIIKPLWHHRFRDRAVVPGEVYALPEGTDCSGLDLQAFGEMCAASERDIVRTLAVGCLLGGAYAELVCSTAGADKNTPAVSVDAAVIHAALGEVIGRVTAMREPVITDSGCWPIAGIGEVKQRFSRYNEALEAYYPPVPHAEVRAAEKRPKLTREEVIRRQQEEAIKKFDAKIARAERIVEAVYMHYPLVQEVITTLDRASAGMSWQEIEGVLKKSDLPAARTIMAVHPADAAVDIDIGERVTIRVHESVEANLERYYAQIKKFKKKKEGAIAAMARGAPKRKEKPKEVLRPMKKKWFHRFRWFYTSDGTLVIGGRDASQNEELVRRYMEGKDTFAHADVHGGSVVIIKGETGHLEDEVAPFAASYSNAWKAGHFSADVYFARPDQVSKTAEAGEFVARGGFIVRGERRYVRDAPLGVAIGVQVQPEVAVIGGPIQAVKARTDQYVELLPGTFGPNDVAKKATRILKERVGDAVWKSMRPVLNTEAIAAFVPPGESDIRGENEG
ncbi:ribosome rescue protein RqcH [Methanofollis fontis]|uniref:NFACT RNA-binding domain-containing protein n=1 Tax=Methanofollis fontis TaxID=2052832 RepID=A0A483CW44_9EURY|nr:ribosome rescue protein RqcH [Methanofollis fontis]TAJ43826.1 hypothetical protein CUJ86_07095 [Methanofollis fontis]